MQNESVFLYSNSMDYWIILVFFATQYKRIQTTTLTQNILQKMLKLNMDFFLLAVKENRFLINCSQFGIGANTLIFYIHELNETRFTFTISQNFSRVYFIEAPQIMYPIHTPTLHAYECRVYTN